MIEENSNFYEREFPEEKRNYSNSETQFYLEVISFNKSQTLIPIAEEAREPLNQLPKPYIVPKPSKNFIKITNSQVLKRRNKKRKL